MYYQSTTIRTLLGRYCQSIQEAFPNPSRPSEYNIPLYAGLSEITSLGLRRALCPESAQALILPKPDIAVYATENPKPYPANLHTPRGGNSCYMKMMIPRAYPTHSIAPKRHNGFRQAGPGFVEICSRDTISYPKLSPIVRYCHDMPQQGRCAADSVNINILRTSQRYCQFLTQSYTIFNADLNANHTQNHTNFTQKSHHFHAKYTPH